MKVTDKDYYLDDNLKVNLDFCIRRQKKNFDHVLLMDGDEGYGKSTFAQAIGYYLAKETGRPFDVKNIFFDIQNMAEFAAHTEEQIIVWDEAALGGLSTEWQNKTQRKLIQLLMTARKKRHFWIFLIPKFFKLNEYIAVDRSIALVHVYSADHMTRGNFSFYAKRKKNKVYETYKSSRKRVYNKFDFVGKFTNTTNLIDQEAYNAKKDIAIQSIFGSEDNISKTRAKQIILQYKMYQYATTLKDLHNIDLKTTAENLGVDQSHFSKWGNHFEKHKEIFRSKWQKAKGGLI
jgi:hypothetical protein